MTMNTFAVPELPLLKNDLSLNKIRIMAMLEIRIMYLVHIVHMGTFWQKAVN